MLAEANGKEQILGKTIMDNLEDRASSKRVRTRQMLLDHFHPFWPADAQMYLGVCDVHSPLHATV